MKCELNGYINTIRYIITYVSYIILLLCRQIENNITITITRFIPILTY